LHARQRRDADDGRKTGEMNMQCVADIRSGAVGLPLAQGERTVSDQRDRMARPASARVRGRATPPLLVCAAVAAVLLVSWPATGRAQVGEKASARDALLDLLLWGSDTSIDVEAYPAPVRAALTNYLQRRRTYRTKLRRPARQGEARMMYDVRAGYERQLAAASGAPAVAAEYVRKLKPCLEWEEFHDCPEDEARFAGKYRAAHPGGPLSDYLPLLAAHRWLCAAEAYEYEKQPEEAARSRRAYEMAIEQAKRAKNPLFRFAAEGLTERGKCLADR
jgi:hypothetical protein